VAVALGAVACSDTWDDHYGSTSPVSSGITILKSIESNSELSNFLRVLQATECDTILKGGQVLTVFAPVNSVLTDAKADSLINRYIEEKKTKKDDDNSVVKGFIKNHISLYNTSVSSKTDESLTMMNGKYEPLKSTSIGGISFLTQNQLHTNGVLFTIDGIVPYNYNVFEMLGNVAKLDSVNKFLASYNVYEFDEEKSVPGEIKDGKTVYLDSVTELSNSMFRELGYIDREDSTYWMVVPTNDMWKQLYSEYENYYNFDDQTSKRDSLIRANTALSILKGTVFSKSMNAGLNTDEMLKDSANSTNWSKYKFEYYKYLKPLEAGGVFSGTDDHTCSNGKVMVPKEWNIDPRSTFLQRIVREGERETWRDTAKNTPNGTIMVRTVPTNNPFYGKLSNNSFVEIKKSGTNAQPAQRFYLPNVLSKTPYDIYCVFAPAIAYDTLATADDRLPCKVQFTIGYHNQRGNETIKTVKNETEGGNYFYTRADVVDTVKVATAFEFETSSYGLTDDQAYLNVRCRASGGEYSKYQNNLRIDCIIVKPHEE